MFFHSGTHDTYAIRKIGSDYDYSNDDFQHHEHSPYDGALVIFLTSFRGTVIPASQAQFY